MRYFDGGKTLQSRTSNKKKEEGGIQVQNILMCIGGSRGIGKGVKKVPQRDRNNVERGSSQGIRG